MSKRGSYGSMADRLAQTRGDLPATTCETPTIKHCWVTDTHGRLPGLLLEWRQTASGWQGRVVRPVRERDVWVVVEDWLPAGLLQPANDV